MNDHEAIGYRVIFFIGLIVGLVSGLILASMSN